MARAHDLIARGVNKRELSILIFYENFWPVLIAALISGLGVYLSHSDSYWGDFGLLCFIFGLLAIPVVFFANKLGLAFSLPNHLRLTLISIVFWIIASMSFYFYVYSFGLFTNEPGLLLNSTNYMFSWMLGFLSIFTPQGMGVFEVTYTQLSDLSVSVQEAIVLVAGFRIIVFISEMTVWSLLVLTLRIRS